MKRLLLIVLLLIVGCSKEPINYETTLIERDGVYYTKDTNKPYSGPVFSLYNNGQKKDEGTFKNGKKDGKFPKWFENGQMEEITYYEEGENSSKGTWFRWDDKGNMIEKMTFNDDGSRDIYLKWDYLSGQIWKRDSLRGWLGGSGTSEYYHDNGQISSRYKIQFGKQTGPYTSWYEDGQMKSKGSYDDGKRNGLVTEWYENGQKMAEGTYKDGKLISHKKWNEDGSVKNN